jgi:type II secretory pathway pseudopilin PulG
MRNTAPKAPRDLPALLRSQGGMTYLFVMMLVVFLTISLLGVTEQWSVIMKRDREAELIFRGNRIKEAIDLYVADYEFQKATRPHRWPRTLKDLTQKSPKRYLQVAYSDPITGEKFELIKVGDQLHGVKSTSTDEPYNRVDFQGAKTYQAIRFEATGANANCQLNPLNPIAQAGCPPPGTAPAQPAQGVPPPTDSPG